MKGARGHYIIKEVYVHVLGERIEEEIEEEAGTIRIRRAPCPSSTTVVLLRPGDSCPLDGARRENVHKQRDRATLQAPVMKRGRRVAALWCSYELRQSSRSVPTCNPYHPRGLWCA